MPSPPLPLNPSWDLTDLYQGPEDPRLREDLTAIHQEAMAFTEHTRKPADNACLAPSPADLHASLCTYEGIYRKAMNPLFFAFLFHTRDIREENGIRLFQEVQDFWTTVRQLLLFFPLSIKSLPLSVLKALSLNPLLEQDRPYLCRLMAERPHDLSESEERQLVRSSGSEQQRLLSLYDQTLGELVIEVDCKGKRRRFPFAWALATLQSPDRSFREIIFQRLLHQLKARGKVFCQILHSLVTRRKDESQRRGYPSPAHQAFFVHGQIEPEMAQGLLAAVESHIPMVHRILRHKALLLGLNNLKFTDLLAPIGPGSPSMDLVEARQEILCSTDRLGPPFRKIVLEAFSEGWLDPEPREGKPIGAFCKCFAPGQRPRISLHFTGGTTDVITLAHELGHAIHYRLAGDQRPLLFEPSPMIAETAAMLLENTLLVRLLETAQTRDSHRSVLQTWLDRFLATVFRQQVIVRFEEAIHSWPSAASPFTAKDLCRLWMEKNQECYGNDVNFPPDFEWSWAAIPHLFHLPFYCIHYVAASLLSLLLLHIHQEQGPGFQGAILRLLQAGGSRPPARLFAETGLDLQDTGLWQRAFQLMEKTLMTSLHVSPPLNPRGDKDISPNSQA